MVRLSKWRQKEVMAAAEGEVVRRVTVATILVRDDVKKRLNVGNLSGDDPSAEGESPRKVTARLFGSITAETVVENQEVVGRVGTNVEYAPRLELGFHGTDSLGRTYAQGERPYLRPGVFENIERIRKILGAKR